MRIVTSVLVGVITGALVGCGVVGPPVPPENVGVNPIIERQKKSEALEEKQREDATAAESAEPPLDPTLQGQDVNLPPLRPVGTR
jgi:predicted small lipoprotein YifL